MLPWCSEEVLGRMLEVEEGLQEEQVVSKCKLKEDKEELLGEGAGA